MSLVNVPKPGVLTPRVPDERQQLELEPSCPILVHSFRKNGEQDQALQCDQKAVTTREEIPGHDHEDAAATHCCLGWVHDPWKTLFVPSVSIKRCLLSEKVFSEETKSFIRRKLPNPLAVGMADAGNITHALQLLRQAQAMRKQVHDSVMDCTRASPTCCEFGMPVALQHQEHCEKALEHCQQSLFIHKEEQASSIKESDNGDAADTAASQSVIICSAKVTETCKTVRNVLRVTRQSSMTLIRKKGKDFSWMGMRFTLLQAF